MSKIAAVLKQEIVRLARREARSLTKSFHKASSQFRRDIAELKRQNAKARGEIGQLQRRAYEDGGAPIAKVPIGKVRYSAASVRSQRKRLGLSAEAFGKLVGVTAHTVYKWEHDASRPRSAQLAALATVRGIGKTEASARLERLRLNAPKGRKKSGR